MRRGGLRQNVGGGGWGGWGGKLMKISLSRKKERDAAKQPMQIRVLVLCGKTQRQRNAHFDPKTGNLIGAPETQKTRPPRPNLRSFIYPAPDSSSHFQSHHQHASSQTAISVPSILQHTYVHVPPFPTYTNSFQSLHYSKKAHL